MSQEAAMSQAEAIDRLLDKLREQLESAFRNGQRVKVDYNDRPSTGRLSMKQFETRSLAELISSAQSDGSCEYHIYIGPKGG